MKSTIFSSLAIAVLLIGCSQDAIEPTSLPMLNYSSIEEFNHDVNTARSVRSFKTFGEIADEFYYSIGFDDFKSIEEFDQFLVKNSDKLDISIDENGEKNVMPLFFSNPYRDLVDASRMYKIENQVFKVFSNGILSTHKSNKTDLELIDDLTLDASKINSGMIFSPFNVIASESSASNERVMDVAYNCGTYFQISSAVSNKNRTRIRLESWSETIGAYYYVRYKYTVTPQKKNWVGVWVSTSKKITADFTARVDFNCGNCGGWDTDIGSASIFEYKTNQWSPGTYTANDSGLGAPPSYHFGGFDCYADTPATDPVTNVCNTGIL